MIIIKTKIECEKELKLPKLYNNDETSCVANGDIDCNGIQCIDCLFDSRNYIVLLEQQKGE